MIYIFNISSTNIESIFIFSKHFIYLIYVIYLCMAKMAIEISEEAHIKLLEIQLDRKKNKKEPSAINKIAAELIEKVLKEKAEK